MWHICQGWQLVSANRKILYKDAGRNLLKNGFAIYFLLRFNDDFKRLINLQIPCKKVRYLMIPSVCDTQNLSAT